MTERLIGYSAVISLLFLVVGCALYMEGGRSNKWIRRFIGSLVIATGVNVAALMMGKWVWSLPLVYGPLAAGFCMGYGGDTLLRKWIRRSLFCLGVCSAGLVFCFTYGSNAWMVLPLHLGVGAWSIYLGIRNPIQAAAEETFVCALLNLGLMMYPFIVG